MRRGVGLLSGVLFVVHNIDIHVLYINVTMESKYFNY